MIGKTATSKVINVFSFYIAGQICVEQLYKAAIDFYAFKQHTYSLICRTYLTISSKRQRQTDPALTL